MVARQPQKEGMGAIKPFTKKKFTHSFDLVSIIAKCKSAPQWSTIEGMRGAAGHMRARNAERAHARMPVAPAGRGQNAVARMLQRSLDNRRAVPCACAAPESNWKAID